MGDDDDEDNDNDQNRVSLNVLTQTEEQRTLPSAWDVACHMSRSPSRTTTGPSKSSVPTTNRREGYGTSI